MYKIIFKEISKVIIVVYTILATLGLLFTSWYSLDRTTDVAFFHYIILIIAIVSGMLSIIFHIRTYRYYSTIRRKRKISKLYWIAAIILPSYIIYFVGYSFVNFFYGTNATISQDITGFAFMMLMLFLSVMSILEVILMPKRIKKQHDLLHLTSEFNDIGDSTL